MLTNKKIVFLIFLVFSCLFYLDKVILGPYASVIINDEFDSSFRYKTAGDLFLRQGFFAWYPNDCAGMPSYAWHFPVYHIRNLLYALMPSWLVYTILVVSLMSLAGFGMYWFLKDFLGTNTGLSFIGGILFSLYTQVQQNAVAYVVFNYAFVAFFMCLLANWKYQSLMAKITGFIFVLLVLL